MAEHYGTAIVPARVRHPKDKPSVEGTVGHVSTWIIAALRHGTFFSISELNAEIKHKLSEFNERPFQKRPGSRRSNVNRLRDIGQRNRQRNTCRIKR
jgi:hypothetical protein